MIGLVLGAALYVYGWDGAYLPNPTLTPGDLREADKAEVCRTHSSADARAVTEKMKREVYARYGQAPGKGLCSPRCEVDHLLPLELGGSNDIRNLWIQPPHKGTQPGWQEKDVLEGFLHRAVCNGFMPLEEAQQGIRTDWSEAYRRMKDPP